MINYLATLMVDTSDGTLYDVPDLIAAAIPTGSAIVSAIDTELGSSDWHTGGLDGEDGATGATGADGASAYEVAVDNGFVGDEEDWVASLQGADGADGADGAGGDLQDAYDASSSTEILTDATRGALTIKRGSAADSDNVLEFKNGAGTTKGSFDGDGNGLFEGTLTGETNIVVGSAAIATTATDGFVYLGSCPGKPTGTPTTKTGRVPLVYDSTNEICYAYTGGVWTFFGAKTSGFECALGGAIADATYTMVTYATFAFRILGIYGLKHTSGTSSLTVKINTTAVTGLSALSVTSTPQNATASAAYDVAVGDAINFVVASGSSPIDLLSSLKIERL